MGWVFVVLLAAAVALGLWRWVGRDMAAWQFVAAALLVACAGYAWQGRPEMAGAPKAAEADRRQESEFALLRPRLLNQFDRAGAYLTTAEAMVRSGNTLSAAKMLHIQLERSPRDMGLWLGYADVLLQHTGGQLTPASEMAFNRAAQVAPNHPAPRFFYALALARIGQFDAAEQYLQQVLAMPEITDDWRTVVGRAREGIARMRAEGPRPAPPMG